MKQPTIIFSFLIFVFIATIVLGFLLWGTVNNQPSTDVVTGTKNNEGSTALGISQVKKVSSQEVVNIPRHSPLADDFKYSLTLEETSSPNLSKDLYWWVNSGAYLYVNNGVASTIKGSLDENSKWHIDYQHYNSAETDNGFHPQNIFRLVHINKIKNFTQQAYFRIINDNLSADSHRAGSNGLFFFNRYVDGDNVYYTGLRVDGYAVVKKKIKGVYYTMTMSTLSLGGKYDRQTNPDLLPKNTWIGLRSTIVTTSDNKVEIKVYSDIGKTGEWKLVASTADDGTSFGGHIISESGYTGIRTDFMDAEFSDYSLTDISE